ncbi:MAG: hypothetical protein LKJ03_06495 [Enterococcaceae bacterium]|nr:hypothetical protein [Enterococcaceae bacterium]MCI1919742.1 hypothetical protein [Enterococcaceae bacterium]
MSDSFILLLFRSGFKMRRSTPYHLLRGKRTSSILCFGFFYELLPLFGLLPRLSKTEYEAAIARSIKKGLLIASGETIQLAPAVTDQLSIPHGLDAYRWGRDDEKKRQLLWFALQVSSNLAHQMTDYFPLEGQWANRQIVKDWLKKQPLDQISFLKKFQAEWQQLFSALPADAGERLSRTWSGYGQVGESMQAVYPKAPEYPEAVLLQAKADLHMLLAALEKLPLPLLRALVAGFPPLPPTLSATKELLKEEIDFDTLVRRRRLKASTLRDHLLDLAIYDAQFPFAYFVSPAALRDFSKRPLEELRDWEYNEQDSAYDFFIFRLAQIYLLKEAQKNGE